MSARIIRRALGQREFAAIPKRDLRKEAGEFEWSCDSPLAFFDLLPRNGKYPERWVDIELELRAEPGAPVFPLIVVDNGNGYPLGSRIRLPSPMDNRVRALVRFPQPVQGLKLSPLLRPGKFSLGAVRMRSVSSGEAAIRLGLTRAKAIGLRPKRLSRALKNAYLLWRTDGVLGIKRRLAGETGAPLMRETRSYADWIQCYDTLSEQDFKAIAAHIGTLEYQPLITIVLSVRFAGGGNLRLAIESIRSQLYGQWQLCVIGDLALKEQVGHSLEDWCSGDKRIQISWQSERHLQTGLELARGEFALFLNESNILRPHALYLVAAELNAKRGLDVIYGDEDSIDSRGEPDNPRFKPDWNPDLFYSQNYIGDLLAIRTELARRVGGFRAGCEGGEQFDLFLRVTSTTGASKIRHLPFVLGHCPAQPTSIDRAVGEHLQRTDPGIRVEPGKLPGSCRVRYPLPSSPPLVSLLIPTRDGLPLLRRCLESIFQRTDYPRFEIVVIDNQSRDPALIEYLRKLAESGRVTTLRYDQPFNYSAINNLAARQARGEILGLLNNDLEVISPDWLREMVSHAVRPEVGAVGAKLLYPDGRLQHGGVVVGMKGLCEHIHRGLARGDPGYCGRAEVVQNVSVVTAACLLIRRELFERLHGLDEGLPVAFNDVDLCLRIQDLGYRNVFTPYAELYHYESATRGDDDTPAKRLRLKKDIEFMISRWGPRLLKDQYYNPNLSIERTDCSLAFPPRVRPPWLQG